MDYFLDKSKDSLIVLAVLIFLVFVSRLIIKFILRHHPSSRKKTIVKLLMNLTKYFFLFVGIFVLLAVWEVDTTTLLASASFLGLAVGIGAQQLIKDMINGFFIIFENQYNVDDEVSLNGEIGTVIDIGLKTTILRSFDGKKHIISNGDVSLITNFSRFPSLAIVLLEVSYNTRIDDVERVIKAFIKENQGHSSLLSSVSYLGVEGNSVNGIIYRIVAETKPYEHFAVQRWIKREVIKRFQENGILPPSFIISDSFFDKR